MSTKISVIVPIYNVEKYIKKCLENLQKQTFKDFEVLAICDGSPDNSDLIVKDFEKKDSRIKLVQKENGGYGSVLEYAIQRIKSKYFLICDPDDWLAPNCLEQLYNVAEKNNLDLVVADRYDVYIDNNEKKAQSVKPNQLKAMQPNKVYTKTKDIQRFSFFDVSPHSKLFKTNLLKGTLFPKHVSYTDYLLYLIAISKSNRVSYYSKPLSFYLRDRPGNTVTDVRASIINDNLVVWNETLKSLLTDPSHNSILIYRMYLQLRHILSEYSRVNPKHKFHDQYWKNIIDAILLIRMNKKFIEVIPEFENSVGKKMFYKLLIDSKLYVTTSKLFVMLKGIK